MDSMEQASLRILLFAAGVFAAIFLPLLPHANYLVALLLLALALLRYRLLVLPGFFVLGLSWHIYSGQQILAAEIPREWELRPLQLEGVVRTLPQRTTHFDGTDRVRFELLVDRIADGEKPLSFNHPLALRLSWSQPPVVAANQRWRLEVELHRPRSLSNPGTFDYRAWLLARGVGGTGRVLTDGQNRLLGEGNLLLGAVRQWYQRQLQSYFKDDPVFGLIQALAIGEKSQLSSQQRQVLASTGTSHLMVISGLHIGLCAMVGYGLTYLLCSLRPAWVQSGAARCAAGGGALILAGIYAALAGFSVPTLRALLMLLAYFSARQLYRETSSFQVLFLALAAVLLLHPLAVIDTGFWLSFTAVAVLLVPVLRRPSDDAVVRPGIGLQCRLLVALGPLMALLLGQSSLLAPLVNVVAIPLIGFIIVPLVLAALLLLPLFEPLGISVLACAGKLMGMVWYLLSALAELSDGWSHGSLFPTPMAMIFSLMAVIIFLLPRGLPGRAAWPLLLLPMLMPAARPSKELDIYLLDVGQGTAIVVQTPGHVLLYDAGPAYASGFDAGSSVVLPFLRRQGISRIDRLVVSHGDSDHSGGVSSVIAAVEVQELMAPAEYSGVGVPDLYCLAGMQWQWDEVTFKVLHPGPLLPVKSNNQSCVIAIESPSLRVLLAGDIERAVERKLVAQYGPQLRSDVILIPHHGSRSSSSYDFAWFTRPAAAVATVGYRNRFAHPAAAVHQRYSELGSAVVTTAEAGALHFDASGRYKPYRWFYTRYWQHYPCSLAGDVQRSWLLAGWQQLRLSQPGCQSVPPSAVGAAFMW